MPIYYTTYMVRCADGSLYTGFTVGAAARRVAVHNAGRGARYTRSRRPVVLVWEVHWESEHAARSCEALVKRLSKKEKEAMAAAFAQGAGDALPPHVRDKVRRY